MPDKYEPHSLIILYDPISTAPSSREIIDKVNKRSKAGEIDALSTALGNPDQAKYLIESRLPEKRMQLLTEKAPYSPDSLLQRYVVLTYPNSTSLNTVMKKIREDKRVLSVEKNIRYQLASTLPNDEFFSATPPIADANSTNTQTNYQWGLDALNFPEAWDFQKGHAYIGMIDTGIDIDHPDLQDNFRPHLSAQFSKFTSGSDVDDNGINTDPIQQGHGTHVAGILAASANNIDGVAGACWHCNLMVSKSDMIATSMVSNINHLLNFGAQAINMSFTGAPDSPEQTNCSSNEAPPPNDNIWSAVCTVLKKAVDHDVVLVASAGNVRNDDVGFPAGNPNVISVGAIRPKSSTALHYSLWDLDLVQDGIEAGSSYGPHFNSIDLAAPGQHVMSTWIPGMQYFPELGCGDDIGPGSNTDGYGLCSGTSMAAPHVTALAGLIKSTNPLLSRDAVKTIMTNNADHANNRIEKQGYGVPDAEKSVKEALGTVNGAPYHGQLNNRLTPLFSFYLNASQDSFYTTVPQMGSSILKTLNCNVSYPQGSSVPDYDLFPDTSTVCSGHFPRAEAYLFTTHNTPAGQNSSLKPLYRLYDENTGANHAYVLENEKNISPFNDYTLEGIAGYIYNKNQAKPSGATALRRAYSSSKHDHILYTGNSTPSGYTNPVLLGYVYENIDSDSDGLINGFEQVIGTSVNSSDTDGDGFSDGDEIGQYPYTDPRNIFDHPRIHMVSTSNVTHSWKNINIPGGYKGSIVIAGAPTTNGGEPGVVRLQEIDGNNFKIRFQEWDYLDGQHIGETVSSMVIKKGRYNMPDGTIWEAGMISRVHLTESEYEPYGLLWNTTSFSHSFPGTPKLFLTAQTSNGWQAVTVRARNVTANGFQSALFEQECNMVANPNCLSVNHIIEDVGYLAIYKPTPETQQGTVSVNSTNTNYNLLSKPVGHQYINVLGTNYRSEEEQSQDAEINHLPETLSIMHINSGRFAQDTTSLGGNTIAVRRTP